MEYSSPTLPSILNCSRSEANYLLHVMDGLTFLQLALVSLFSDTDRFCQLPSDSYEEKRIDFELLNTLAAIFELFQNGILKPSEPGGKGGEVIFDLGEIRPAHMALSPTGTRLFDLAGLATIGDSTELKGRRTFSQRRGEPGRGCVKRGHSFTK